VIKDRETLLAFYDFLAEHWKHLRTSNPIESTFATIRHRKFNDGIEVVTKDVQAGA
jgi:transposase-like protein